MQGIVKALADGDAFREGTWGAEILDELKPQEGDKVVGLNEVKNRYHRCQMLFANNEVF